VRGIAVTPYPPILRERARRLRREQTEAERRLWFHLRGRRFSETKFRRQQAVGHYIVDFCCVERKLIVEIDGGQHAEQSDKDRSRDAYLAGKGFRVLRFWNHEVLTDIEAVLQQIWYTLLSPHPNPLPEGEGKIINPRPLSSISSRWRKV
jgi:adenine-specific DNA-methyltransferase